VHRRVVAGIVATRNEAFAALEASIASQRKHDADVTAWQQKLKAMREQLADAQAQLQQRSAKPAASSAEVELALTRSKATEQERAYRALQQRHQDALQQIAALQLEVQRLQSSSSASASSSSPPNALAGLTELQRQQLALRTGTQQTLQRLQQLFPDQQIG
jgi:chromosome segregation ATPase